MAEVLSTQSYMIMDMARNKSTSGPLPNPSFVFPLPSDIPNGSSSHGRSPSCLAATGSRRAASRSRPQRLSLNALPAFEFSPAASSPVNRPPTPPRSPTRRNSPPHHVGGHRRNGSEFVGGDITSVGSSLVSSSPTKSEHSRGHRREGSGSVGADLDVCGPMSLGTKSVEREDPSHSQANPRPAAAKRGHTHRRSGAISSHDLSMTLKPAPETKSGSAPASPSDSTFQRSPSPPLGGATSQPSAILSAQGLPMRLTKYEFSDSSEQQRSRAVGFSDVLEYIPRPLSTVSSETSSSMSTIRASHSVTNSITSIVSSSTSVPTPANCAWSRSGPAVEQDQTGPMPITTGACARSSSGNWMWSFPATRFSMQRPSTPPANDAPKPTSESLGVVLTRKRPTTTEQTHADPLVRPNTWKAKPKSTSASPGITTLQPLRRRSSHSLSSPTLRPRTSPEPKVKKRQRKRKSWADLLSRKVKQQEERNLTSRRSPTPPLRKPSHESELSLDDIDFDNDTTFILETGSPDASRPSRIEKYHSAPSPPESSPLSDDSVASMLDIDAALESTDLQCSGPAFEDVVGSGALGAKRRMHSSGVTGGFAGPGMHYHRRAESAPELEPIDRPRFGFPHIGSNPVLAIEEEEEEADEEDTSGLGVQKGLGVDIVESTSTSEEPMQRRRRRNGEDQTPKTSRQYHSKDFGSVEIVGADEEPRFSVVTISSDESTITPTLSHDPLETRPASAPLDFAMPTPALTYGTPETRSSVSSPDLNKTSFDIPRIHTASSSITDRATLNSNRTCNNSFTMHSSVDDVPSLTSSASTTSARQPRFSSGASTFSSADRSFSLSAAVPPCARPISAGKRASFASLTRLVGGPYNRSKLNIEMSPPPVSEEPMEKKRGHRINRLKRLFKSKNKHLPF